MSKETHQLDIGFIIICLTLTLIFVLITYSRALYPLLSKSLGGGKSPYIEINHENSITKGKMIHTTKDLIFLLVNEETDVIKIIEWIDTNEILAIKEE